MEKKEIINIFAAYTWTVDVDNDSDTGKKKNKFSGRAIKEIITRVQLRLDNYQDKNPDIVLPKLFYSRLRSTSGSFVFESIRERMSNAYAVIFDITDKNPNVMLELGIALELQRNIEHPAKVFLIACAESFSDELLPSDLRGYFLTTYWIDETQKLFFGDSGSLVMRIFSDILELTRVAYVEESTYE